MCPDSMLVHCMLLSESLKINEIAKILQTTVTELEISVFTNDYFEHYRNALRDCLSSGHRFIYK